MKCLFNNSLGGSLCVDNRVEAAIANSQWERECVVVVR